MKLSRLILGLMLLSSGCSSGSGAGVGVGETSSGATCADMCEAGLRVCSTTTTKDKCVDACEARAQDPGTSECAAAERDFLACGFDRVGCPDEVDTNEMTKACLDQAAAYTGCVACAAGVDDDDCDVCAKQNCCAELETAYGDKQTFEYSFCIIACVDEACFDTCATQDPDGWQKLSALANCELAECAESC